MEDIRAVNNFSINKDLKVDGIDGIFHIFECYGRYFIFFSENLSLCRISESDFYHSFNQADCGHLPDAVKSFIKGNCDFNAIGTLRALPTLTLVLTHLCNMNCDYCFDKLSSGHDMEYNEAVKKIDFFARKSKRFHLNFFGGEPLLKFELIKAIVAYGEKLKKTRMADYISYGITTNGKLLNEVMIGYLNSHGFSVTISIDGFYSEKRKNHIGSGNKALYDTDVGKYKELQNLCIRATIPPDHIHCIYAMYNKFSELEPSRISFLPAASDLWHYSGTDAVNWKRQLETILYHNEKEKTGIAIDTIHDMIQILRMKKRPLGCGLSVNMTTVDSDGTEYPCHRFIGKGLKTADFASFGETGKDYVGICENCWAHHACFGICRYNKMYYGNCQEFNCNLIKRRIEIAAYYAGK